MNELKSINPKTVLTIAIIIVVAFTLPYIIKIVKNVLNPIERLTSAVSDFVKDLPYNALVAASAGTYIDPAHMPDAYKQDFYNFLLERVKTIPTGHYDEVNSYLLKMYNDGWITNKQREYVLLLYKK